MSENKNKEIENVEEKEFELSPNRDKIFKSGLFYLVGLLILALPIFLLGKLIGNTLDISKSGVTLVLFVMVLLPAYLIWKKATTEIEKHDDYGYDGKLKFSYYLGMIGTTAGVTLVFIGLLTGFIYLLRPNPFKADIGSFQGETYTVKKLQNKLVTENPTVRPGQLKRIFGTISFENYQKIMKINKMIDNVKDSEIKEKYKSGFNEPGTPNKSLIFNQLRKHFIRQALYKESLEQAKKDGLYQNLINTGIMFDKFQMLHKILSYKLVMQKVRDFKPDVKDIKYLKQADKLKKVIHYKQISIYNKNHKNDSNQALKQAKKAQQALKQGKKWKTVAVKFNQQLPRQRRNTNPNHVHKADATSEIFAKYFGKPKNFIPEPIKLPYGWIVIQIVKTDNLSDKELIKKPVAINEIKAHYKKVFEKEFEDLLENKYRKHVNVDYNLLYQDKKSTKPFIKVAEEIYIPVIFFWKNLSDKQENEFSNKANLNKVKEYIENSYIKPIMAYLEAKQMELHKKDFAAMQIKSEKFSRYIEAYIKWYLIPKKVDPEIAKDGKNAYKEFYKKNARHFSGGGRRRQMRPQPKTPPKPYEQLDAKTKERVKKYYKNSKIREIVMSFILDKLLPKYKVKVEKDYFKGKVPPANLKQFASS